MISLCIFCSANCETTWCKISKLITIFGKIMLEHPVCRFLRECDKIIFFRLKGKGVIVAFDKSRAKVDQIKNNCELHGFDNVYAHAIDGRKVKILIIHHENEIEIDDRLKR